MQAALVLTSIVLPLLGSWLYHGIRKHGTGMKALIIEAIETQSTT